jgi:hypothetical protein
MVGSSIHLDRGKAWEVMGNRAVLRFVSALLRHCGARSRKLKLHLYKSPICPFLLCGPSSWEVSDPGRWAVEVAEMCVTKNVNNYCKY